MDDEIEHFGLWVRVIRVRQTGSTTSKRDIYINAPCGQKLRSTHDLAKYIRQWSCYDVNPREVNFEMPLRPGEEPRKLRSHTNELIKFVETKGKYTPAFMLPRQPKNNNANSQPLKTKANIINVASQCYKCNWYDDTIKLEKISKKKLCEGCILCLQGKREEHLQNVFKEMPYLPTKNSCQRLELQTELTKEQISSWFLDAMSAVIPNNDQEDQEHLDPIKQESDDIPDISDEDEIEEDDAAAEKVTLSSHDMNISLEKNDPDDIPNLSEDDDIL